MTEPLLSPATLAALDRLSLVSRRMRAGTYKGERRSPRRGGSIEFADYREYAPGDDFRQIDWRAYARLERLFLRLYVEEEDATVHLLLDASRSMEWGSPPKWAYAQRIAAALGYLALVGMDRLIGGALGGRPEGGIRAPVDGEGALSLFPPHRGKKQALAWFNWLAGVQPQGEAAPEAGLARYGARVRRPGPLILISDLMDDGWREGLRRLAESRYEVTVLHLLAPQERHPDLEGDLKLVDSETDAAVEITADLDLLARYRARVEGWQQEWREFCAARAIAYVAIESSLPLEELVFSFLPRQGVLR